MAVLGNYIGGALQGMQGLGGLQQQQDLLQQWVTAGTGSSNVASTANTYVLSMAPVEAVPAKPKGPETALEWLDRRVNEVRLPLAA